MAYFTLHRPWQPRTVPLPCKKTSTGSTCFTFSRRHKNSASRHWQISRKEARCGSAHVEPLKLQEWRIARRGLGGAFAVQLRSAHQNEDAELSVLPARKIDEKKARYIRTAGFGLAFLARATERKVFTLWEWVLTKWYVFWKSIDTATRCTDSEPKFGGIVEVIGQHQKIVYVARIIDLLLCNVFFEGLVFSAQAIMESRSKILISPCALIHITELCIDANSSSCRHSSSEFWRSCSSMAKKREETSSRISLNVACQR